MLIGNYCINNCQSNNHEITTTKAPILIRKCLVNTSNILNSYQTECTNSQNVHINWEQTFHMTKSRETRYDMASAHCSVEIDIVKCYAKDKNISYMGAVVIVIAWWLDVRPPVPITTNVVVRTPFMARCTLYNIMWCNLSVTSNRSVIFFGYSGFFHQYLTTTILLTYCWKWC